jgi:hypothetical protein
VLGTNLENLCIVCDDKPTMQQKINHHFNSSFNQQQTDERKQKLNEIFNNTKGAKRILQMIE